MKKAIFLSTDLLIDLPASEKEAEIITTIGSVEALRLLQKAGYSILVCNNEPGVAGGILTEEDLTKSARLVAQFLVEHGVSLSGFYYCPHVPNGYVKKYSKVCYCKKPSPGLFLTAARDTEVDLASSWTLAEVLDDVEAGNRADTRTVFIDTREEFEWNLTTLRCPNFTADSIFDAACLIVRQDMKKKIDTILY